MFARPLLAFVAFLTGPCAPHPPAAQPFPQRPISLVVPFPPGGTVDIVCRFIADKLSGLGQPVVVENRSGGGANIGAEYVSRAAPDGHVLLCGQDPIFIGHLLNSNLAFDPQKFEPVSTLALLPSVLVARADFPARSLAAFVDYARAHPGRLNYASQGVGQFSHLTFEALKLKAGIDLVHIPYRGGAPALNDLLAGQVDVFAAPLSVASAPLEAGRLKLLAITGRERLASFPDTPTLSEVVPELVAETWLAIAAPPGTPEHITAALSKAIGATIATPEVRSRMLKLHTQPWASGPGVMRALIRETLARWQPVIAAAGIRLN